MLTFLLIVIFLGVFGTTMTDTLWGNTLRLINLIFSATIASSLSEPVAKLMESLMLKGYFFYNFVAIWFVFLVAYAFFRFTTQQLSKVNVKFHSLANVYGGKVMAAIVAAVFVSFLTFSMHQAPLYKNFLGFNHKDRLCLGLAPDRQWHDYMVWVSSGVYNVDENSSFDPKNTYAERYSRFRAMLELYANEKNALGVANYSDKYAPKRP
ncbi:MAG: CvpA family protein [Planctomycetia bacterium]|nr:CvpA family protein [Planctomycetia bacterium]